MVGVEVTEVMPVIQDLEASVLLEGHLLHLEVQVALEQPLDLEVLDVVRKTFVILSCTTTQEPNKKNSYFEKKMGMSL